MVVSLKSEFRSLDSHNDTEEGQAGNVSQQVRVRSTSSEDNQAETQSSGYQAVLRQSEKWI